MVGEIEYPEGAPCWPELTTLVPEQAKDFYGALLGWTSEDIPFKNGDTEGVYTVFSANGKRVAGLMTPSENRKTLPALWHVYLASENIDRTVQSIGQRGGRVLMEPCEIPDFGRMAFGWDSAGAPFGVWQALEHKGSELYSDLHAMCWSEINTFDGPRTDAFYQSMFSYTNQEHVDRHDGCDYTRWIAGNRPVCERRELNRAWGQVPAQWLTYFVVSDCDAAVSEITRRGGEISRPPWPTPHGRACIATDPDGAWFAVCEHSNITEKPAIVELP